MHVESGTLFGMDGWMDGWVRDVWNDIFCAEGSEQLEGFCLCICCYQIC